VKILLVTGSFPPMRCGVGDYASHLAQALAAHEGVEVGVLTSHSADVRSSSTRITVFATVEGWRLREAPRIMGLIRRWQPDIVHIQWPAQGYGRGRLPGFLPLLCRLAGYRVVQTWHELRQRLTAGALLWLARQAPVSGGIVFVRPRSEEMLPPLLRIALRNKVTRFIPNASVFPRAQLTQDEERRIREKFGRPGAALVAYFGFIYPAKGIELLFEIADPEKQHILIIGEKVRGHPDSYYREVSERAHSQPWTGKATLAGFLPAEELSCVIAAADAVVLPFLGGGGEWNTSIHGAQAQGTFVVTTSTQRHGFDAEANTYFAAPGDVVAMRAALERHIGRKLANANDPIRESWQAISAAHLDLYRTLCAA
jgi:glycosyltransferase involved in cell wall biosynthesis